MIQIVLLEMQITGVKLVSRICFDCNNKPHVPRHQRQENRDAISARKNNVHLPQPLPHPVSDGMTGDLRHDLQPESSIMTDIAVSS
jgi:hypothetical protein